MSYSDDVDDDIRALLDTSDDSGSTSVGEAAISLFLVSISHFLFPHSLLYKYPTGTW